MEQIISANHNIMNILGKARPAKSGCRLIKYCLPLETEEGFLLFHVLTRELLLLTPEEYSCMLQSDYLREHWFVVPEELNEKEQADLVRWVLQNMCREPENINNYTILTTTDCNARCFYCYEKGCTRISMSEETACKTADYIREHCGEKKVRISWFGGEPLMNVQAIDRICERLQAEGMEVVSSMVSNGYLFSEEIIAKAVGHWHLRKVQITLDGTEEIYNRSKAFIYRDGSAYQVVTGNIARLLEAGIAVVIRLNLDLGNAENLLLLTEELAVRFKGKRGLQVYAHQLFDADKTWHELHTQEEWKQLYEFLRRIEEKLRDAGLSAEEKQGLRRELPVNHCMADSGNAAMILPDGHLGLCEHYVESEFYGHIDSKQCDRAMIDSWRERSEEQPECSECFYYPECTKLKKCTGDTACFSEKLENLRRKTERKMANELRSWKKRGTSQENEGLSPEESC